jgi:hypothetical protein
MMRPACGSDEHTTSGRSVDRSSVDGRTSNCVGGVVPRARSRGAGPGRSHRPDHTRGFSDQSQGCPQGISNDSLELMPNGEVTVTVTTPGVPGWSHDTETRFEYVGPGSDSDRPGVA